MRLSAFKNLEILYVGDPMCTWCWGIADEFRKFRQKYSANIRFTLLMGGIRAGEHAVPLDSFKESLKQNWISVQEISGQPFNLDFFKREGYFFDSEPACRAVNAMHRLLPERIFEFKEKLEEAFYAKNQDLSDSKILASLGAEMDIDKDKFMSLFDSNELRTFTQEQFDYSDTIDVRGLPTILISKGNGYEFFCKGYTSFEKMEVILNDFIQGNSTEQDSFPVCEIGNPDGC